MKLVDKLVVIVYKFKGVLQSVFEEFKGIYEYLLDGLEEMVLEIFLQFISIVKDMVVVVDELYNDFEKVINDVIDVLEDIQRVRGFEEKRKKVWEEERKEFEIKKQKVVMQ